MLCSDVCRHLYGRRGACGFTLLEMLVVMVLLGMLTSLALPAMQRWHDAVQAKSQAASLVQSVRAAVFASGVQQRVLRLTMASFEAPSAAGEDALVGFRVDGEVVKLRLPFGWRVRRVEPADFLASGLCEPGVVVMDSARGAVMALRVQGPICEVTLEAQSSS